MAHNHAKFEKLCSAVVVARANREVAEVESEAAHDRLRAARLAERAADEALFEYVAEQAGGDA